jgi:hypothetical protein
MPEGHKLPPCPRCRYYDPGITSSLCNWKGVQVPIFYASLKNGPEFKCFQEKGSRNE